MFKSLQEFPFTTQESHPFNTRNFSNIIDLQWNSTGSKIAFSKLDKSIYILHKLHEIENFQIITNAHDKPVESISFHPVREYLFATVANDNECKIWECNYNSKTYKLISVIKLPVSYKNFIVKFSPDGQYLLIIDKSNHITFVSTITFKTVITFHESNNIYDFTWSNINNYFLLSFDHSLITINTFTSHDSLYEIQRIHSINSGIHNSIIKLIKFDPCGKFFITGSQQGIVQLFSTLTLTCTKTISDVDEQVTLLDISKDGAYIAVCYESVLLKIYDLQGVEVYEVEDCSSGYQTDCLLKFSPLKGNLAFSTVKDGGIVILSKSRKKSRI